MAISFYLKQSVGFLKYVMHVPDKPLLMLQSIKRAFRLDSSHHHLHDCLVRFQCWLDDNLASLNPAVAAVINKEIEPVRLIYVSNTFIRVIRWQPNFLDLILLRFLTNYPLTILTRMCRVLVKSSLFHLLQFSFS